MGGCWTKTKDFISSFLVYDTVSIVRISDKRLAILHYLCMIGILFYVFIWTIYYNQEYYRYEAPVGTVRINPMSPVERPDTNEKWNNYTDLPYCKTENRTKYYDKTIYPCKYFDSSIDVFPQAVDSSITLASRVKFSTQVPVPNGTTFNTSDSWWNSTYNETYYLADIDRFTLQIDHTFYGPTLRLQGNARDYVGKILYDMDDDKSEVEPCFSNLETIGKEGELDIISVCTLLKAAQVDIDKMSVQGDESIRNSGAIFLVFLDYQNSMTHLFKKYTRYTIHVEMINNTEYKAVQTVYTKKLDGRTIYNRHGLHFVFLQTGKLVKFDLQVLLLSLVTGMGMLAFSTTIVDLISTKVLGNKDVVSNLKYKTTPNLTRFTDEELSLLASKLRRTQEEELALNSKDSEDSAVSLRQPLVDRETDDD